VLFDQILNSNINNQMLIPFPSLRKLIFTLKKIMFDTGSCNIVEDRPLWLNKMVRYRNVSLFYDDMVNAGITDYGHLL